MRAMNQEREIRVSVDKLLKKVRENRDKHEDDFLQAMKDYRSACFKALEEARLEAIACCEDGEGAPSLRKILRLRKPENAIEEYDEIIQMLEFQEDVEMKLSPSEFSRWVIDKWDWKREMEASWASNKLLR